MQKNQLAKLNMSNRTKTFLDGIDPATLAAIPFLSLWFGEIKNLLIELAVQIQAFDEIIKGYQKAKKLARQALIVAALNLAAQIRAYADALDDIALFENMAFTKTLFVRATAIDFIAYTKNIADAAAINIASLAPFGVTPASLAQYIALRTTYLEAEPKPDDAKLSREASTVAVEAAIKAIVKLWVKIDRAMRGAAVTQPLLAQDYFRARIIIDPPSRTNAVHGIVTTLDGTPMPYVTLTCQSLGINRRTTKKGRFIIKSGENTQHILICNYPGYKEVRTTVTITTGLRKNIIIMMEPLENIPII